MSNWMVSHAWATIFTPLLTALVLGVIIAVGTGDTANAFAGTWIVIFITMIAFFISFLILFFLSFFQATNEKSYVGTTFAVVFATLLLLAVQLLSIPEGDFILFIVILALISSCYTGIQYMTAKILRERFSVMNEDVA